MKAGRVLIAAAVLGTIGFLGEVRVENTGGKGPSISFGPSVTEARPVRRVARRTARRTTRRVVRRHAALPYGCPLRGLYYYCGGVYYEQIIDDGATVYVIVTP